VGAEPERSASGPWTWLAAGLGLLVIVASGILLFLLFSGIGEADTSPSPTPTPTVDWVKTPEFVGRTEADALRLARSRGLILETGYTESDEDVGRVIDQLPGPGVEISVGTSVQVTVATQSETVVVPDVYGIKEAKAIDRLQASGLKPGARFEIEDPLPEGYVVSTDPRAGVSMTRGSLVDYVVSTGRAPEPSATRRPARTLGPATLPSSSPASVSPGPSAVALPSASSGPSPFPSQQVTLVGDFLCLDLATARGHIEEAGLILGATIPSDPSPTDDWLVHDQLPKAGESVPVGSNVDLVLMDPLEACP